MLSKANCVTRFSSLCLLWPKPFVQEPVEISHTDRKRETISWSAAGLIGLSAAGFAVQIVVVPRTPWAIAAAVLWAVAALYLAAVRPTTVSIPLLLAFVGIAAGGVSSFAFHPSDDLSGQSVILGGVSTFLAILALVVVINMPLRDPASIPADVSRPFTTPSNAFRSPEDNLTLFQWMTVSWLSPLIKIGNQRQLHDEDVWLLGFEFQHRHLHNAFRELRGTLVRRLLVANWIDLVLLTILAIFELVANYSVPVILQKLLQAMEKTHISRRPAVTFALLILMVRLVAAQSAVFSLWFGRRCYERARGEMITMLYEKTLNRKILGSRDPETTKGAGLANRHTADRPDPSDIGPLPPTEEPLDDYSQKSPAITGRGRKLLQRVRSLFRSKKGHAVEEKSPASMGKILNLMRNDVYQVAQRFWEFQTLINKPLGLVLSVVLTWRMLGWSCLVGMAVVFIAQLFNYVLARILISWEKERRKATDVKLQRISQYVEAIRHLRWYGWHLRWLEDVMTARQREVGLRIVTYLWNCAIRFVNSLASGLLPVASFFAYTALAGHQLRVDIAFPALQLFALMQTNIRELPALITVLLEASVAVGRIEGFISEPERSDESEVTGVTDDRLEVRNATFSWPGLSRPVLQHLNLSFPQGLTVVYGPVAAGKTALLQALLGELDLLDGQLFKPHVPVGYCAQTPWLQSMSIRENILFNSPYEEARYKKTLEACALLPDLASFKHGDLSHIGEDGIGLSGGQRARVALARAVYSRTQILLLDDPVSALDQQTAEWIVTKCLVGSLMNGRTVVLVTHRIDLCQHVAAQFVEISHGTATLHRPDENLACSTPATVVETGKLASDDGRDPDVDEAAAVPDKFVEDEHRVHGGVQWAVYWEYIKAGRLTGWFMVVLTAILCRITYVLESWFLKEWSEAYNSAAVHVLSLQSSDPGIHLLKSPIAGFFDKFPNPATNVQPWLLGLLVIVVSETLALFLSQVSMLVVTYTAAVRIFKDIMDRISGTTFHYYDVTPVGRLMNRLTSDVGTVDSNIADQFLVVIWYSIAWLSSMVVIASVTPVFLVFAIALTLAFVMIFLRFIPTSQSLRRLEMVSLSPLMSNFGALLNGLMTVRAFCAQPQFQERNIQVTDAFQKMDHFYWSLQAWLMYRFDALSAASTFLLTVLAVFSGLSAGLTAFVLVAANKFVQSTHAICKQYGQLQLDFVSVERVVELLHLEQEDPGFIKPPAAWPRYGGDVVFEKVTIRYQPHLEPALSEVSLRLKGGTTNAIIGRTGSGKSTLALALLTTIPLDSGRILIDGIDIAKVDKQTLRTRITFLAQDPILFPGSLRHNLDPMEEHSDYACEGVLSRVCGKYGWTLETAIDNGGRNLSQGQRQLVGLARAILRRSAVVIMDEATASIDLDTASEIQRVLKEELQESTIITIAHRAAAVEGADVCVVLSAGRLVKQNQVKLESQSRPR
ncbi:ATPase [Capronia epimyces CBS 606.96]|uniref:ATPase n=1 Tax=Capronia epimyces CBS 606.96 TaxID=1182542 RepID=W9XUC2_9EURO|nr:ATPase [Capronia epimyces CBS 606.96]EXJ80606.1 ATPase [Capronia epimyces CBS 606.96]